MQRALRKPFFAFPFGCLVAVATHAVRFGDDHAFGGDANAGIVAAALGGSIAAAALVLHAFLTAGRTTVTATIARARVGALLPGAPLVFAIGATLYEGIEALEGHGVEFGLSTLLLAAFAAVIAWALRVGCASLARIVDALIRAWIALGSPPLVPVPLASRARPPAFRTLLAARRFGRAPPKGSPLSR